MPPCDLLIADALVVEASRAARRASVGVRDGAIVGVWDVAPTDATGPATRVVQASSLYLIPGLVNTHTHLFQTLLRGLGDRLVGGAWFSEMLLPAAAMLEVADAEVAASIGCAEALLSGVTTVMDFMQVQGLPGIGQAVVRGMRATGVRAIYGRGISLTGAASGMPARMIESAESAVEDCAALVSTFGSGGESIGLTSVWVAPYAVWALLEPGARTIAAWAAEHDVSITVHASDSPGQVQQSIERFGLTDLAWLDDVGLLTDRTLVVHAVQLDPAGIARMARSGAAMAHCPIANLYGGAGVAPVPALRRAGVRVGLGTDGAASNNSQNLFETMKFASLVQRGVGQLEVGVDEAFRMATLEGAAALGLADQLGRIEPGYRADLVLLDPNRLPMAPHHHPISDIVYAGGPAAVESVFVDGRQVVDHGRLTQLDAAALLKDGQSRSESLLRRAGLEHLRYSA